MAGYEPMTVDEKRRLARLMLDLRTALTVGNPAPVVQDMWERHKRPEAGDWVVETSTLYGLTNYPGRYDESLWDGQFTRFLRTDVRHHPAEDDEDDGWSEEVLVCENPDGTEFAWTNAELAVAPIGGSLRTLVS